MLNLWRKFWHLYIDEKTYTLLYIYRLIQNTTNFKSNLRCWLDFPHQSALLYSSASAFGCLIQNVLLLSFYFLQSPWNTREEFHKTWQGCTRWRKFFCYQTESEHWSASRESSWTCWTSLRQCFCVFFFVSHSYSNQELLNPACIWT